ncbi:MAG: 2-hydroxychromene-2-carboxylate isomerase [Rhodospirillales bacterium]
MESIEFWYDFASPYSYLAAERIGGLAVEAGVALRWQPFVIGPILKLRPGQASATQDAPPAQKAYRRRDVGRSCAQYGLALNWPTTYPRNGLLAARVALAASDAWRERFSIAVYRANFVEDREISNQAVIASILQEIGQDADVALAAALLPANKALLIHHVDEAIARGIFGAPSFMIENELFWGNDRLEQALQWAKQPWL